MGNLIIKAALKYIEKNPEVIEELLEALIKQIIQSVKDHNDKKE